MNDLIWFLTDTDFEEEWRFASFLQKVELLYTTIFIVILYPLNFLLLYDFVEKAI